ncbi:Leucine Rich Repeat family expressed [Micractinium conductrix]|uniref:Leucine Rich Repeat family expressed n=1 Tax=Micractinium conductrix TaxID=554055 RepID=A0A2P6VCJ8_9CHLO|nr:Leucine Rich Repeat family expressed [Micractinium conductrix]|eukprot:PSC71820.1 Leucine Rich Repeat family expressed [Micractinium conductrix]
MSKFRRDGIGAGAAGQAAAEQLAAAPGPGESIDDSAHDGGPAEWVTASGEPPPSGRTPRYGVDEPPPMWRRAESLIAGWVLVAMLVAVIAAGSAGVTNTQTQNRRARAPPPPVAKGGWSPAQLLPTSAAPDWDVDGVRACQCGFITSWTFSYAKADAANAVSYDDFTHNQPLSGLQAECVGSAMLIGLRTPGDEVATTLPARPAGFPRLLGLGAYVLTNLYGAGPGNVSDSNPADPDNPYNTPRTRIDFVCSSLGDASWVIKGFQLETLLFPKPRIWNIRVLCGEPAACACTAAACDGGARSIAAAGAAGDTPSLRRSLLQQATVLINATVQLTPEQVAAATAPPGTPPGTPPTTPPAGASPPPSTPAAPKGTCTIESDVDLKGGDLFTAPSEASADPSACCRSQQLTVVAPLAQLTTLQHLELTGRPVVLEAHVLPPHLTSLCLNSISHSRTPLTGQLRHVGGSLLRLELSSQGCRPGGYAVLTALTQLTALRLMFCDHLPACLSVLTTLEELVVRATPVYGRLDGSDVVEQVPVAALEAGLATLTKLTSLFVSAKPDVQHDRLPASFTALVHLRRLAWCCTHQPLDPRLPGGAWLAHLDTLVLPAAAAAGSLEVLNGAGQLAMVGVQRQILLQHRGGAEAVAAVVAWAAPRPALRRVVIDYPSSESVPTALAALALL